MQCGHSPHIETKKYIHQSFDLIITEVMEVIHIFVTSVFNGPPFRPRCRLDQYYDVFKSGCLARIPKRPLGMILPT